VPGRSGCLYASGGASLRIARASGASALRFQARLITEGQQNTATLQSRVWALDAGSSVSVRETVSSWPVDSGLSADAYDVSSVQDVTLELPPGSSDVLLVLGSNSGLWLDSVRTE
jgi:hypothetical protein